MTRVVDIKSIISELDIIPDNPFAVIIHDVTVVDSVDLLSELHNMYYEMSYVSHREKDFDVLQFIDLWTLYKRRHADEWERIFDDLQIIHSEDYDPTMSYYENKVITPNISTASSQAYNRQTATSATNADNTIHGSETVAQSNTYEGELRDAAKTTIDDTNNHMYAASGTDTSQGVDTALSTTTGTTSEHRQGSRDNVLVNLQTDIDFTARNNLRDLIINNFVREFLFYNNDNREVNFYGFYY